MELAQIPPALLVLAVFLARIADVSLATVRMLIVFRGNRLLAAGIGLVEVTIWLLAAGQLINHLDRWYLMVAYAAGFSSRNCVGVRLESKLAIGFELVRAISIDPRSRLAEMLRKAIHDETELDGRGTDGEPIEIALLIERRRRVPELVQ